MPLEMSTSATSNPFERLKNHQTMAAIKATSVPWLIAGYGMHYADGDNVETASNMLTHVIISQPLCGYTASTFPPAIDGHRVEQVIFTKFILKTGGKCCVESVGASVPPLEPECTRTHTRRKGQHRISQGYSAQPHQVALLRVNQQIASRSLWLRVSVSCKSPTKFCHANDCLNNSLISTNYAT